MGEIVPNMRKCYLSGAMSGIPANNRPMFVAAAKHLRGLGFNVISPAEMDEEDRKNGICMQCWSHYMKRDIPQLLKCDLVAVLPDWIISKGARLEVHIAKELGMMVVDWQSGVPLKETILQEAQRIVYGERNNTYGHPAEDFGRTGKIGAAVLEKWKETPKGTDIPPNLVALFMVGVKISREVNAPGEHRDNLVDGAGYFGTCSMIYEQKELLKTT